MKLEESLLVINAPDYTDKSGGIIALHTLAEEIYQLGYNVRVHPRNKISSRKTKPGSNYKLIFDDELNSLGGEFVAIYPEIDPLNPLNAKYVVRWLLFNVPIPWNAQPEGCQIGYNLLFLKNSKKEHLEQSYIVDFSKALSVKPKDLIRDRNCFTRRKDSKDPNIPIPYDESKDFHIKGDEGFEKIIEIFNRSKYFYSHDIATAWAPIAALMGCIPVLLHNNKEIRTLLKGPKYGVACGLDDLEWAESTQSLVRPHLKKLMSENRWNAENFIQIIKKHYESPSI